MNIFTPNLLANRVHASYHILLSYLVWFELSAGVIVFFVDLSTWLLIRI